MAAMARAGSPPIWRVTERNTARPITATTRVMASTSAISFKMAVRTRASISSMYRPEPTIQFQPSMRTAYCSLGTQAVLPGRVKVAGTNALPSLLARS